jgi:hypothetical protein
MQSLTLPVLTRDRCILQLHHYCQQLTQHYLEAIYAHLQNTRGKLGGAAGAASSSSGGGVNMAYGTPAGRQGNMPGTFLAKFKFNHLNNYWNLC